RAAVHVHVRRGSGPGAESQGVAGADPYDTEGVLTMRQPTNLNPHVATRAVSDVTYHKPSYSNGNAGCVSIAVGGGLVGAQDSKLRPDDRSANTLVFSADAMHGFLREQRNR